MNRLLLKLNLKTIFRSLIFYLFLFFTIFGYAFLGFNIYLTNHYTNFLYFFNNLEYMDAVMYVLLFCVAAFFAQQKYTLEKVCFIPTGKIICMRYLSVAAASSVIILLPVLFMAVSAVLEGVSVAYTLLCILYAVIRWIIIIATAEAAGFLVGFVFKNPFAYLFSIPFAFVFTVLNEKLFAFIFKSDFDNLYKFVNLFSIQRMFLNGPEVEYRGPQLDMALFSKLFLALALFFTVFFIIRIIAQKKIKLKAAAGALVSAAFVFIFSYLFLTFHPVRYEVDQKLYIQNYNPQPFEIVSISGDINLNEWSYYSLSVRINGSGSQTPVTLRLDESMQINKFEILGQPVSYEREGDLVTFDSTGGDFTLDISCRGRVSYVSSVNSTNIYTSATSCALPPDFAFLPKIDGDYGKKQYNLNVTSLNTLVSNLDINRDGNVYHLSGSAGEACFFTGFLTEYQKDGSIVYRAKYNQITDYDKVLERYVNQSRFVFDRKLNMAVEGDITLMPKMFLIYSNYGTAGIAIPYDDYILINYGNVSAVPQ